MYQRMHLTITHRKVSRRVQAPRVETTSRVSMKKKSAAIRSLGSEPSFLHTASECEKHTQRRGKTIMNDQKQSRLGCGQPLM